jgi:transglutaminase-like putative cysteine protease
MQLHIRHETRYRYDEPVKRSVQNLRLTPRRDPMQRAVSWNISAPGRRHAQIDAYGNVVHLLTLDEPHHEIRIVVDGLVETLDSEFVPLLDDGRLSPLAYLAETNLTKADEAIRSFAASQLNRGSVGEDRLLSLASAVRERIEYVPGATEVHESAAQAFSRSQGVCQDHAHIFIACCRSAGVPARYVSGYLYTTHEGHVASHAWADAWIAKEQRWVSIDVTQGARAGSRYCRLAVGRDYMDACPVRGVRRGGGQEKMDVAVLVSTSAQQ